MDDLQAALLAASSSVSETSEVDYLVISNDFRTISIPRIKSVLGVYNDSNVNRVWFKGPRYYGDVDLSTYDFKINFINAEEDGDVYIVDDLTIDGDNIIFSWLVGPSAFIVEGNVIFNVCAKILNSGATEVTNEFNTTIHTLPVLKGLEIDNEYIRTHYPTFIDQIEALAQQTITTAADALASKNAAAASAAEALNSKNIAANSASSAINSKNDAANSALLAKQYADSLNINNIYNKIYSAFPTETVSGSIVTFSDGANDLPIKSGTIHVEPVQDLHGYDSPWPAGGGVNLLSPFTRDDYLGSTVSDDGLTVTTGVKSDNNLVRLVLSSPLNVLEETIYYISFDACIVSGVCKNFSKVSPTDSANALFFIHRTIVANPDLTTSWQRYKFYASARSVGTGIKLYIQGVNTDNAVLMFSNVCISTVENYDFAPYSNECPISGWTGSEVTRTGRNLLDTKNYDPTVTTSSGITIVQNQDGSFKASGTATGVVKLWLRGSWGGTNPVLKLYAGKTYFIKDVMFYRGTSQITNTAYIGASVTYTPTVDIEVTAVRATCPVGTTLDTTIYPYVTDSGETEWQEFGNIYHITFPAAAGTVYGATYDPVAKRLTVDRAIVDLGTLSWSRQITPYDVERYYSTDLISVAKKAVSDNKVAEKLMCSVFIPASSNNGYAGNIRDCVTIDIGAILSAYPSKSYSDSAAFKSAMSGVQLVYELANPIIYDLTDEQIDAITTFLGDNTLWADTGAISLTYRADPTKYIDKRLAELSNN